MLPDEIDKTATLLADDCMAKFDLNSDKLLSQEEAKILCMKVAEYQLSCMMDLLYKDEQLTED